MGTLCSFVFLNLTWWISWACLHFAFSLGGYFVFVINSQFYLVGIFSSFAFYHHFLGILCLSSTNDPLKTTQKTKATWTFGIKFRSCKYNWYRQRHSPVYAHNLIKTILKREKEVRGMIMLRFCSYLFAISVQTLNWFRDVHIPPQLH